MNTKKFCLAENQMPTQWYNIVADMPTKPLPPLDPATKRPVTKEQMSAIFAEELIDQEMSTQRFIDIPEEVQEIYKIWRPTPLVRATGLEKALDTPAKIYFKNESVSPAGSHKPNTAVPQAYYNYKQGIKHLTTETGAGQWGASIAFASKHFGIDLRVFMVRVSYDQKPYRRLMMNTWGDRSQDTKVNERFCLEELERAARLGITHFQIDDGWQEGKSPNSALAKGSFRDIWANPDYWKPAADKYPSGLDPVVERARELGIEVGLWFNPSVQDDFAAWEKDADALLGLYRRYGIKVFKIDGLSIPTKRAETNLRRLFDRVGEESGGDVLFNLDATASRRGGYHMFNEYGNIFLENRYTDWGNYFPYRTLRNLWQLSRYVPAERIQVEFLNKWRNADKYAGDPFAPAGYGFDYLFATTMAGQPLAWLESSNLPEEAFAIAPLVREYRAVAADFHAGIILPVGEEPSGRSWTGFQSLVSDAEGYLLLYREAAPSDEGVVETFLPEGAKITLTRVLGSGDRRVRQTVGRKGALRVSLPAENTFVLYKYSLEK